MKFGSRTPSRVLKDHLRRTCLLNSVITDHCFYRFVYINNNNNNNIYRGSPTRQGGSQWGPHALI